MKASPRQQRILLELQDHDHHLARLRRQRTQLPERAELAGLQGELQAAKTAFLALQHTRDTQQAEIARLESDITMVRDRRKRDEDLLAHSTNAKEAAALQDELDTLAVRQAKIEDRELEIMEVAEKTQTEYEAAEAVLTEVDGRRAKLTAAITAAERAIDGELSAVSTEREGLAAELQRDILGLYEEIRARTGLGAARLRAGVSEGSNMALAPAELQQIRETPRDEIVFCPGSGAILVRELD